MIDPDQESFNNWTDFLQDSPFFVSVPVSRTTSILDAPACQGEILLNKGVFHISFVHHTLSHNSQSAGFRQQVGGSSLFVFGDLTLSTSGESGSQDLLPLSDQAILTAAFQMIGHN
jgi:hypothetical protein